MYEWAVRRVHEADYGLVHAAGKLGPKMRSAEVRAEFREFGRGRRRGLGGAAFGICHEHPDLAVAFLAGKRARVNAIALELGIRSERGNRAALASVRVKLPAVIRAFDRSAIELAEG